jgi:hypothetical protein
MAITLYNEYLRNTQFESRLRHRLSWLMFFVVLLFSSKQKPEHNLDYFMIASFLEFNSSSFTNPTNRWRYIVLDNDSILK